MGWGGGEGGGGRLGERERGEVESEPGGAGRKRGHAVGDQPHHANQLMGRRQSQERGKRAPRPTPPVAALSGRPDMRASGRAGHEEGQLCRKAVRGAARHGDPPVVATWDDRDASCSVHHSCADIHRVAITRHDTGRGAVVAPCTPRRPPRVPLRVVQERRRRLRCRHNQPPPPAAMAQTTAVVARAKSKPDGAPGAGPPRVEARK